MGFWSSSDDIIVVDYDDDDDEFVYACTVISRMYRTRYARFYVPRTPQKPPSAVYSFARNTQIFLHDR